MRSFHTNLWVLQSIVHRVRELMAFSIHHPSFHRHTLLQKIVHHFTAYWCCFHWYIFLFLGHYSISLTFGNLSFGHFPFFSPFPFLLPYIWCYFGWKKEDKIGLLEKKTKTHKKNPKKILVNRRDILKTTTICYRQCN